MFPLNKEMHNDATVSDWLGTASLAAKAASRMLDNLRDNDLSEPWSALRRVEEKLTDALDEVREVRAALNHF